jgi:hypothetical protein
MKKEEREKNYEHRVPVYQWMCVFYALLFKLDMSET